MKFNLIFRSNKKLRDKESEKDSLKEEYRETNSRWNLLKFFNSAFLKYLQNKGDVSHIPREIFHFAYFKNGAGRENFAKMANVYEFHKVDKFVDKSQGKFAYGIKMLRIDRTSKEDIKVFTDILWDISIQNNGFYKNWDTYPVTDK